MDWQPENRLCPFPGNVNRKIDVATVGGVPVESEVKVGLNGFYTAHGKILRKNKMSDMVADTVVKIKIAFSIF
jgi:hypothetical protein